MTAATRWSLRNPWALTAGLVIFSVTVLIAAQWPVLPWFLDYFYHLSVVEGFRQSGGPVLKEWWEFAPAGRPHLYPPLWHCLSLPLVQWGLPPIVVAKSWCVVLFPLSALTLWAVARKLFDSRIACWMVIFLGAPFSLTLAILNYPTSTLACLFILLAWIAIEKHRPLAAALAIGLIGYTHTGSFWLFAFSLILYGVIRQEVRRILLISLGAGALLASPWLIHQWMHAGLLHLASRNEGVFVEFAPFPWLLAGWGVFRSWKPAGPSRFAAAWWLGNLPMLTHYRFRLLSGHGLLPTILLAGWGAADLWKRGRPWRIALILLLCLWPTLHREGQGFRLRWGEGTVAALSGFQNNVPRVTQEPIHFNQVWEPVARIIQAHTQPDELFACNLNYAAGLLTILSHRAATVGMLGEVAKPHQDPVANARVLVWIKQTPSKRPSRDLEGLVLRYRLQPLGQTDAAILYYNPLAKGRRHVAPAVLPWWLADGLIVLAGGLLGWDLRRSL